MAQVDSSDYKSLYMQTAKEYVVSLLAGCNKLINDSQNREAISQIHISSHSLKSQSQVMGFTDIADLSGNIEKISKDILDGVREIDNAFMSLLKHSVDELNLKLAQIERGT